MANISPFKGIFYNMERIDRLADVVTPPYDVISDKARQSYYDRHPQNIIRLTLGNHSHADTQPDLWQARAAAFFKEWRSNQILVQDHSPALYLTAHDFSLGEHRKTRYGFIGLVDLESFEKKIIIPHEKTFSKIKTERYQLIKACQANFSPIFSLFLDGDNALMNTMIDSVDPQSADLAFSDEFGHRHRLWKMTDPLLHRRVSEQMADKKIYIADGHHRYETALNYREWISRTAPDFSPHHPANKVMMYLCGMEEPGLVILPAHRIIKGVPSSSKEKFKEKCESYFNITPMPFTSGNSRKLLTDVMAALGSGTSGNTIGVFIKNDNQFLILTLKPDIMKKKYGDELHHALLDLDVMVLTRLILEEILGFDQTAFDSEDFIDYISDEKEALEEVRSGEGDIVFLLNATKIQQVQRIAEEGLVMPRKATYFYPKVVTGMVLNSLRP